MLWLATIAMLAAIAYFAGQVVVFTSPHILLAAALAFAVGATTFFQPWKGLVLLIFAMLLSPQFAAGGVGGGRQLILRADDMLLLVIFAAWFTRSAISKEKIFLRLSPIHLPIFIYATLCVVSTGLGIMDGRLSPLRSSLYAIKYMEYFMLFFMTYNLVSSREQVSKCLKYGYITAVIVTIYAYWYHFSTGDRASAPFETPVGSQEKKESEPATLGGYYLVVLGVMMGMGAQAGGSFLLWSSLGLIAMAPASLYTYSRATYAGLLAASAGMLATTRKRLIPIGFAILLAVTALGFVREVREQVVARVTFTFKGGENRVLHPFHLGGKRIMLEDSAAQRVWAWERILLKHLPRHPLLGHGATGIGFEDTQYGLVLGEFGLIGLGAFLWLIAVVYREGIRLWLGGRADWERGLGMGLCLALTGLLIQAMTTNTFIIVRVMMPFWFLVALVARLNNMPPEKEEKAP